MIYESFHPDEKYTTRIKNILTEYPDGSQILREILQNSDDAKSTVQIFILNHKTYPSETLCDPKLERYQGPSLLSANDTIFKEEDFKSLVSLANSEKIDKYDKIGVMGIGFNSIFHISDVSSIISGSSYVFIDPHARKYCDVKAGQRGFKVDFIKHNMFNERPDQFEPFLVDFLKSELIKKNPRQFDNIQDGYYNGTIFRYPLRTPRDAEESEISKDEYRTEQIKDLFKIFFKVDNINCLLFLKHIEKILFFELKEDGDEPELLYEIGVNNAKEIFNERKLLTENIISMMSSPTGQDSFETIYKMKFSQKAKVNRINNKSEWLIVNYISSTNDEKYIKFKNHIRDCKFIPNVGLAARIDKISRNKGKLYCFLPLPDDYDDFSISINGCFAVSKNRRHLEISMNEDLAPGDLLRLKGAWNRYLFEKAIPEAWKILLTEIIKIKSISYETIYTFWPLPADGSSRELDTKFCLWNNLLQNVINLLEPDLKVFRGPSGYLSINDGYLADKKFNKSSDLSNILEKLGFPIFVKIPESVVAKLENSLNFKPILKYISPEKVCDFLKKFANNQFDRFSRLSCQEKLLLLEYILGVIDVSHLHGIPLLPVENNTFTTFEPDKSEKMFFITCRNEHKLIDKKHHKSIIYSKINDKILSKLQSYAKNGKDINIQILSELQFATMLKSSLKGYSENSQEIPAETNEIEWIYEVWDHLLQTKRNLSKFDDLHLLPIKKDNAIFLRKLKATPKCLCRTPHSRMPQDISIKDLIVIFKLLGSTFIDDDFERKMISKYEKLKNYVIELDDVTAVLLSFGENQSFPHNITESDLRNSDKNSLVKYLSTYLQRESYFDPKLIEVIKYFPIFTKLNDAQVVSVDSISRTEHYLLPKQDETSSGLIISPRTFLATYSSDISFLLEKVLKVKRLDQKIYWRDHVIKYLNIQSQYIQDELVEKLFQRWEIIKPFRSDLSEISFVTTSNQRKKPTEIFDPNIRQIKDLFFSDESFFPTEIYLDREYLHKLRQLGMKNSLTIEDIINRLDTYARRYTSEQYSKSLKLLKYIDDNYNHLRYNRSLRKEIQTREWIPGLKINDKIFSKASECRDALHQHLVSHIMPIVQYQIKNDDLRQILGWNNDPPLMKIIDQLLYLISLPGSKSAVGNQIYDIYEYLNNVVTNSKNDISLLKNKLSGKKWIFNDDNLYSTDEIVFSSIIKNNDMVILSNHNKNNYSKLFVELGVKHEQDYFEVLKTIEFSDKTQKSIIDMIEYLSHTEEEHKLKELLIPNMNGKMVPCKELFYDDMDTRAKDSDKDFNAIVHSAISRDVAKKIKLKNFSEVFLKGRIDLVRQNDNKFDHEEIVFQEFLKNADDAGAEQFCIILDECTYPSESLIKEDMKCWQGPAIWIYNEKEFSSEDLESLNDIGRRSIKGGPDKIGKQGLGFASCYNFTDMPQILSGWKLMFFDPQRKIFSDKRCYGSIFDFENYKNEENHIMKAFKDQFEPYLKLNGCGLFKVDFNEKFNGTLFRLPLRTVKSPISDKVYNVTMWQSSADIIDRIERLLDIIKKDAISELIFLRQMKSIKVFRKKSLKNTMNPLWDVEIKKVISGERESLGKKSQVLQLDVQYNEPGNQYDEKNIPKTAKWLICAGENDSKNLWSAIATIIPEKQDEVFEGKFYSYLSLSNSSKLPIILHSNGWELSSNRRNLAENNEDNINILNNISHLHVELFEEFVKIGQQKNENYQIISQLWPIPEVENDIFKLKEYGQKVLENLCRKNSEIFWSPYDDGKYVSLTNSVFINDETPENIVNFLNKHNHPTVKIRPEYLNEFKEKSGYRQVNPQLIRDILKNDESILDDSDLTNARSTKNDNDLHISERFSLLEYILEDKNYHDLETISLVPLFDNKFGKFATEKNYIIATLEELKLFPKAGSEYFIPIDILELYNLVPIFCKQEFSKATNIQYFGEPTIRRFLQQELHPISERDWNPSNSTIPNQKWLNEIWSRIIKHSLLPYQSFPLLEVYDPNTQDQHQLISLENAACKPLLAYPTTFDYQFEYIPQTLINLGIRFTKHKYNEAIDKYIKLLRPDNVLNVIEKYQCIENQLIDKEEDRKNLCQYFTEKLSSSNYHECTNKHIFKRLPIWPTHILDSGIPICKSISDTDAYLVPLGTVSSKPFTFFPQKKNGIFYYDVTDNKRKLLEAAGAKKRNRLDYFKDTFVQDMKEILPQQQNSYSELLIEMLSDTENLDEIKSFIKNLKIFPDEKYQLYVARDLHDQDNPLLKIIYKSSSRFLPKCIQSNQNCLDVLEELEFVRKITSEVFIKCAKYIQGLYDDRKNNMIEINDLRSLGSTALHYFYRNQSTLKFSDTEWEDLSKIKFVPISKSFLRYPYSYSCKNNMEELECFENLCLSKYKDFAWTQLAFFEDEPTEEVIKNYENLGQPTITNIVDHLKTIQSTVSKSKEWEQRGDELFEIIKQIYEKLESLCAERSDDLELYFSDNSPLFLNSTNPLDSESWTIASHLDINIKKDFKPERKATSEYLKEYSKLLILAGAKKSDSNSRLLENEKFKNFEETNAHDLINSMIDSIEISEHTSLHNNVSFHVNGKFFYANLMILSCAAPYFKRTQRFSFTFNDIKPDSLYILLRWLYGEPLLQAINHVSKEEYENVFIQICEDLLKLSNEFELESLKQLIEYKLFEFLDINLNEEILEEVKSLADEFKLTDLLDHSNMLREEYC
ncbi:30299_t:CDS:2 [Gigaspora margarita]|uniref:30299_t:CDS:1 n=1 Tax=Gigaspora margarita TaxID=4874 RepID=A0ABN7UWN5_GIGMA|nr:30299_t:CDS:2 [Gigaspora margarita]